MSWGELVVDDRGFTAQPCTRPGSRNCSGSGYPRRQEAGSGEDGSVLSPLQEYRPFVCPVLHSFVRQVLAVPPCSSAVPVTETDAGPAPCAVGETDAAQVRISVTRVANGRVWCSGARSRGFQKGLPERSRTGGSQSCPEWLESSVCTAGLERRQVPRQERAGLGLWAEAVCRAPLWESDGGSGRADQVVRGCESHQKVMETGHRYSVVGGSAGDSSVLEYWCRPHRGRGERETRSLGLSVEKTRGLGPRGRAPGRTLAPQGPGPYLFSFLVIVQPWHGT